MHNDVSREPDHDTSIDDYIAAMIRAVPPENRPPSNVCCTLCPHATPMRDGENIRFHCGAFGVFTWPNVALDDCLERFRAIRGL